MKFSARNLTYAALAGHGSAGMIRLLVCLGLFWGAHSDCFAQELPAPKIGSGPTSTETAPDQADQIVETGLPTDCQELFVDPPISGMTVDISPRGPDGQPVAEKDLPTDCNKFFPEPVMYSALELHPSANVGLPRCWCGAGFCHPPVYLEDPCLERCGVSHGCLQPTISAFRFFGGVFLLPLEMLCTPPRSCVATPGCF